MIFDAPWYALLILTVPISLLLYAWSRRQKKAALEQLIGSGMIGNADEPRGVARLGSLPHPWTLAGTLICLALALMQPLFGMRAENMPRTGRDIVLLLDTSLSMLAEDVAPNRMERAKAAIRGLVSAVKKDGGHRLALIAFAGRPTLQCPLTIDYDLFLKRLDDSDVETIGREGSLIGDAIVHTIERVGGLTPGFADLILLTDGEDHGGLPIEGAMAAAAEEIDLYTLGIGNPEKGAPIPIINDDGERSLLEYDGFEVRSRVQSDLLAEMAQVTQGRFLGTEASPDVLAELYHNILAGKPRRELDAGETELPAHRFQWFVLLALLLLIFDQLWVARSTRTA